MEKIKCLLHNRKNKIKPVHINHTSSSLKHSNVYQPNFLAKINRIALERDIKHLGYEELDENVITAKEKRIVALSNKKNYIILRKI